MIKVYITKQSNYPVSAPMLKKKLTKFLQGEGIVSDTLVDVAIVGEQKMLELASEYLNEEGVLHDVLSFTATEVKGTFSYPPDGMMRLGDIVVCYPKAVEEAKYESKLIDAKVYELIEHGAMHLLGKHHDALS